MTVTPREIEELFILGQIRIINKILSIADNYVEYSHEENKNVFKADEFKKAIGQIGKDLKANYFPPAY